MVELQSRIIKPWEFTHHNKKKCAFIWIYCVLLTGTSHQGGYSHEAVVYALQQCGIRHIDTAKRYGCEEALGKAVVESGVPREQIWLTTKLWPADYGYRSTKQACRDSCARLGVDYLGKCVMLGERSIHFRVLLVLIFTLTDFFHSHRLVSDALA